MRFWPLIVAVVLSLSTMSFASSHQERARGAKVFAESGCMHCHTIHGSGGRKGPDLSGVGRRRSEAEMRKQIMEGSKIMPAFGDALQDAELNDLLAYLRSCRDKEKK